MAVIREDFTFTSTTGDLDVHAISWKPEDGKIKCVLQLVHGMAEHMGRYDEMARYFAERGFAVYGSDHIGHGESVNKHYPLGYFGKENKAGRVFVDDAELLTAIAKHENPGVPFVLFGHSMGSFVARAYSAIYGNELDAVIYCGTGGPPTVMAPIISLVAVPLSIGFGKRKAKLMNKLSFLTYNGKTDKRTVFDWLSVNTDNVDKYIDDPLCGFCFSKRGFYDLTTLLQFVSRKSTFKMIPKDLPILMIAGTDDPVGEYGLAIKRIYALLKFTGHKKVEKKLFEGSRHEIHNEKNNEEVYKTIYKFIEKNVL